MAREAMLSSMRRGMHSNSNYLFTYAITALPVFLRKRCLPVAFTLIILCLFIRNAEAVGLKLHYEVGDDTGISHLKTNGIPYRQGGLDIVLSEGETFELFLGGEHAEAEHKSSQCFLFCSEIFHDSYKYDAGVLGMHIKPVKNIRVNPYLMLGVVSGTVRYDASISSASNEVTSLSRDKASFSTCRTGLGLNINAIKNLSVDIEANYIGSVPDVSATVSNAAHVVNASDVSIYNRNIQYKPIVGISWGVRYRIW